MHQELNHEVYRQNGGYASVEKAMKEMTADAVVEEVKIRTSSWWSRFPAGLKWSFIDKIWKTKTFGL
jgi:NADH-quinone oxidoreductase subunit F